MAAKQDADGWLLPDDPRDAAIRATSDGTYAMRFERDVAGPPEKVWAALTTPERMAEWVGTAVTLDLRPGGLYLFKFPGQTNDMLGGVVHACEPPHLLSYEVNGTGGSGLITWELTPRAGGCKLTFTQTGLIPWWFFGGMAGWYGMIDDAIGVGLGLADDGNRLKAGREPYMNRWRRYERLWGDGVPGWNMRPKLRHHEPVGLVVPNGAGAPNGTYDIQFVRRHMLPISQVWAALTEPARLADWFAPTRIDLRVGGAVEIDWGDHVERHTILELKPPGLMVWGSGDGGGIVRWELYQEDASFMGTRLLLTNTLVPAAHALSVACGWHTHLADFPDAAARDEPLPWSAARAEARTARETAELVPVYRARLP